MNLEQTKLLTRNKTLATIALILILTFFAFMASTPSVKAANIETRAFLTVNPNPVGVEQSSQVTVWLQPLPPTAFDVYHGLKVTITKPDGTTETRGPLTTSVLGSQFFEYVPTQVGTYTLQFDYPGETYQNGAQSYSASQSPITQFIVQQQPVSAWPEIPVPTDYWTRPINAGNRLWSSISGNWLMRSYYSPFRTFDSAGGFNPYSQAPRAPHVMWTKELDLGGLVGGEHGSTSYYQGLSYQPKFSPPIVMNGRLYYNIYQSNFGSQPVGPGFVCVDLRTGQELWRNEIATIQVGQLYNFVSGNQMGVIPFLWSVESTTWQVYNAFTGDLVLSFANAIPAEMIFDGTIVMGNDGTMYVYYIDGKNNWLAMWNSTKAFEASGIIDLFFGGPEKWLPAPPGTYDWRKGIQWNVTIPHHELTLPLGVSYPTIRAISDNVIVAFCLGGFSTASLHVGYDATTGKELWVFDRTKGNRAYPDFTGQGEGIYVQFEPTNMQYIAFDLKTGAEKWASDPQEYPWGAYLGNSFGPVIANGKLYGMGYDGYVHCYDITNGKQLWKFSSGPDTHMETPYGTYPFFYGPIIADGVVFAGTGEHSPTQPLVRGEHLFAIDANTGKQLWNMSGFHVIQAIADGYLLGYNAEDNRIYCFGKGPSATTVTASPKVVTKGSSVIIEGSVTDQSSGQQGTPAISDEDMGSWMEYLKMQKPIPASAKGVPVTLTATGPDGKVINIGAVTSDMSGLFSCMWTPSVEGKYTFIATFAGSDSYGSSSAETAIGVTAAASTTETTTTSAPLDLYIIVATIVIIIAIAIVGMMILRKRS